jgi:hypothetical protein
MGLGGGIAVEVDRSIPLACSVSAIAVGKNSIGSGVTTASPIGLMQPLSKHKANRMYRKRWFGRNAIIGRSRYTFAAGSVYREPDLS